MVVYTFVTSWLTFFYFGMSTHYLLNLNSKNNNMMIKIIVVLFSRTTYNAIKSEYNRPKKIPSCGSTNQSPTPDWVKGVVYYGCAVERKIYELDFDGNVLKTYDTKLPSNIKMMVFDPWRR